jgi:DNA repair exonuclease SbcCD ATPase subunit
LILFQCIRWRNFLSTGNAFTEIDFTRNKSTLIVGENGAGKSTILDALSFGLYGKPFRKINKPQLINSINGKGLEVEVEFKIGKRTYKIRRGIKPTLFEIYQDDKLLNQDAESKEYQEMFENNILKLNHKSFCQIVVLGSASFVPFMQLSAIHRREVIEDLLDIQIFSTMNNILKEKVAENKNSLTDVDYKIRISADKIELQKKHIENMKQNNDDLIKQKEVRIEELNSEIKISRDETKKLMEAVESATNSISDDKKLQLKHAKIIDVKRQLEAKLDKLHKEIEFFRDHDDCPTCRQNIVHDHKKDIVSRDNDQMLEVTKGIEKLDVDIENISIRLKEIIQVNKTISEHNVAISNHNVQISTLLSFVQGLNREITALKQDKKIVEDNSEELKQYKTDLKEAIELKESLVKDKQLLDIAVNLLRDGGIKTKIIKQYVPVMNKLINKYLASMDFFVNFELNENFEETIKSRHRDEFSYESFSEGEKMRIDLALLFTWRAVAKLRNSASTNLLIMDEVFDSSLDTNGTDEFLKILSTLTADTNVFIISHKGDTLFDKFEHILKFEKHKNFSRIAQ